MAARLSRAHRSNAGFTLVELATIAVLIVLILAAAFPKVHSAYSAETVREARYLTEAYLTTARAASVQKGRTTVFHSAGQRVWVTTDSSGGAEFAAVEMLDALVERGHECVLLSDREGIGRGTRVRQSGDPGRGQRLPIALFESRYLHPGR